MTTPPSPRGMTGLLVVLVIALGIGCMISSVRKQKAPDWQPAPSTSATVSPR